MAILYYIDGNLVSEKKAKEYYIKGLARHGYEYAGSAELAWKQKSRNEVSREFIFDMSAIQERGGLEIVIDED